jgi:hypothetical protein
LDLFIVEYRAVPIVVRRFNGAVRQPVDVSQRLTAGVCGCVVDGIVGRVYGSRTAGVEDEHGEFFVVSVVMMRRCRSVSGLGVRLFSQVFDFRMQMYLLLWWVKENIR